MPCEKVSSNHGGRCPAWKIKIHDGHHEGNSFFMSSLLRKHFQRLGHAISSLDTSSNC
jgi:hypothetical protein